MEDDLRYPEKLIADDYEELPRSDLPVARGSMPGSPHKELEEEDNLISGRGVIP